MSNNTQTLDQVIKRIVGAAFDAGVQAATRPRAEREAQRLDQAGYAAIMISAQVEAARLEAARVIDGDTIVHRGQTIRIMGLDAPEVHHRCTAEKLLAERARLRLVDLLAGGFTVREHGRDRNNRVLAEVFDARGMNVASVLIAEGLARRYNGRGPRELWC